MTTNPEASNIQDISSEGLSPREAFAVELFKTFSNKVRVVGREKYTATWNNRRIPPPLEAFASLADRIPVVIAVNKDDFIINDNHKVHDYTGLIPYVVFHEFVEIVHRHLVSGDKTDAHMEALLLQYDAIKRDGFLPEALRLEKLATRQHLERMRRTHPDYVHTEEQSFWDLEALLKGTLVDLETVKDSQRYDALLQVVKNWWSTQPGTIT